MELRGQRIVLVGASAGLGRALAKALAAEGAHLFLVARRGALLQTLAEEIRAAGGNAEPFTCDSADEAAVARAFAAVGDPDALFYNAGVSQVTRVDGFRSADAKRLMGDNYFGFLHWLDHFLPHLHRRGRGFLAATTALTAYRGIPSGGAYAATKGALGNFVESLRLDLEPHGIPVFQIMPGLVHTPMSELNNLDSPFFISAEEAADVVVEGLRAGRSRIEFSAGLSAVYKLLRLLPDSLYSAVFSASFTAPRANLERLLAVLPPFRCFDDDQPLVFDGYARFLCACGRAQTMMRNRQDVLDGGTGQEGRAKSARWTDEELRAMTQTLTEADDPVLALGDSRRFVEVVESLDPAARPPFLCVDASRGRILAAAKRLRGVGGGLFYWADPERVTMPFRRVVRV